MPKPRPVLNAFTPAQASRIVGMSIHMLNYLARQGYLVPHYFKSGKRGRTRYYSYRDLVIARLVQSLLDAGLELKRLKDGLKKLSNNRHWSDNNSQRDVKLLATDGRDLFFVQGRSTVVDLTNNGQMAFAFVLDVSAARRDVESRMSDEHLRGFDLSNRRIRFA
jgi:DNA-binding transcriptional MerR regulator